MKLQFIQNILIILFIISWSTRKIFKNKKILRINKEINLLKTYSKTITSLIIQTVICFSICLILNQESLVKILKLNIFNINILTYIFFILLIILIGIFIFVEIDVKSPKDIDNNVMEVFIPKTTQEIRCFYLMNLLAPILEEIVYRGFLISSLNFVFQNNLLSIFLSSLIFGISHYYYGKRGIISVSIQGFIFGIYFVYTNSIIINIIMHFIINGMSLYSVKKLNSK